MSFRPEEYLHATNTDGLKILFLGTCSAEHIRDAMPKNVVSDHFLFESYLPMRLPDIDFSSYDGVSVSLTLRHVFLQAPFPRPGVYPCDIAWTRLASEAEGEAYIESCCSVITRMVDQLVGINSTVLLLSFIEPKRNYFGPTVGQYSKTAPDVIVRALNEHLCASAAVHSNMHFLDINDVLAHYGSAGVQDDMFTHMSHASYMPVEVYALDRTRLQATVSMDQIFNSRQAKERTIPAIGQKIADALAIIHNRHNPVKMIIVDLDDTLWRGVAADDNQPDWQFFEGWPLGLVEALLVYKRRGGLLAVCSKNTMGLIREKISYIYKGWINLQDFASIKIDFERKSDNICKILDETNLLPDSVVFIDDNPREIDEVRRSFPTMRVMTKSPYEWRHHILFHPSFQVAAITAESESRTQTIQAKVERDAQKMTMCHEDWLASLDVRCRIERVTSADLFEFQRFFELLNKTNQFNTTGKRWSSAEIGSLLAEGGQIYGVAMRDKLVDNGVVGLSLVRGNQILQTVLSCRVFGLGVEDYLANAVVGDILQDFDEAIAYFESNDKNLSCHNYYQKCGFEERDGELTTTTIPPLPGWVRAQD